jgi:hypothetical protein
VEQEKTWNTYDRSASLSLKYASPRIKEYSWVFIPAAEIPCKYRFAVHPLRVVAKAIAVAALPVVLPKIAASTNAPLQHSVYVSAHLPHPRPAATRANAARVDDARNSVES